MEQDRKEVKQCFTCLSSYAVTSPNLLHGAVILENLIGAQLVKNSKGHEGSLSESQETTNGSISERDTSSPHSYTLLPYGPF